MADLLIPEISRVCKSCSVDLPIERFGKHTKSKNGRRRVCVKCESAYSKARRHKDPTRSRANNKKYYLKIKDTDKFKNNRLERVRRSRAKPEVRARLNNWRRNNLEKMRISERRSQLITKYGLTIEAFENMMADQNQKCAICQSDISGKTSRAAKRRATVDHDHDTGKVRGILCSPCNSGLGQFGDDLQRIEAAAVYLRKYEP